LIGDQAKSLRDRNRRLGRGSSSNRQTRARKIVVTSGKGGVGKSNFSLNMAIALGRIGQRVLLIDADTNLANIDILLGLHVRYTLADVILGSAFFSDALIDGPEGIHILPGSSGVVEMVEHDEVILQRMSDAFDELEQRYDILLIDTGAGLSEGVLQFVLGADDVLLVTNAEPTSITDAYAMVKVATHRSPTLKIHLIVNLVPNQLAGKDTFEKLQLAVRNFLQVEIDHLGSLPLDQNVQIAVNEQKPFLVHFPRSSASSAMVLMANRLMKIVNDNKVEEGNFLNRILQHKEK